MLSITISQLKIFQVNKIQQGYFDTFPLQVIWSSQSFLIRGKPCMLHSYQNQLLQPTLQTLCSFSQTEIMEGLIPLVCRAIKKNNTRRKYRCLSQGPAERIHVADSYVNSHLYITPPPEKITRFHEERVGHRRTKSVQEFSTGFSLEKSSETPKLSKAVVRARSHRMFSCLTGV